MLEAKIVKVPNLAQGNRDLLNKFRAHMKQAHIQGVNEGKDILRDVIEKKKIKASGKLLESVSRKHFVKNTDALFTGTVHFIKPGSEYASVIDKGRPEGQTPPPWRAIQKWMRLKGMLPATRWNAQIMANKIGNAGVPAKPFLREASERIGKNYEKIINKAVREFKRLIKK